MSANNKYTEPKKKRNIMFRGMVFIRINKKIGHWKELTNQNSNIVHSKNFRKINLKSIFDSVNYEDPHEFLYKNSAV